MKEQKVTMEEGTEELCHGFYRNLIQDPNLFSDPTQFIPYQYDSKKVSARFQKLQSQKDRKTFYILLGNR